GKLNPFKTGSGTLILSGGGTFNGNGLAFGGDTGTGAGLLREGTTRITGGTYSFTGEVTVGGVVSNGGAGQNTQLIMDAGSLTGSAVFSIGRGNGVGGVSSDVILNNGATMSFANLTMG